MSILLALGLNILIAAALYIFLNRKIDRQMSPDEMLTRIRREVEGIIRDLNQTTDRNIGLIEDRVEMLRTILENVDRRIVLMKRESERKEVSSALYNDIIKRTKRDALPTDRSRAENGPAPVSGASDRAAGASAGRPSADHAAGRPSADAPGSSGGGPASSGGSSPDNEGSAVANEQPGTPAAESGVSSKGRQDLYEKVVDLCRKGISVDVISARLGVTRGEVELIVSLQNLSARERTREK